MPLVPLGGLDPETIQACFAFMEDKNHNATVSRIESIEDKDLAFFKTLECRVYPKAEEYIVTQKDMVVLTGSRFRHKRNLINFFQKNHEVCFRDYVKEDKEQVIGLYQTWMQERLLKNSDDIYGAMLSDSLKALSEMLDHLEDLTLSAKVVVVKGAIKGFTSGFPVNASIFCVNFEIADLSYKGIAPFMFCEFSKSLDPYLEINMMDDAGIQSIKAAKLSYRPLRTVVSWTALPSI